MATDDIIYALLLLVSLFIGAAVKGAETAAKRQLISTVVGILFVIIVCRQDVWHFVLSSTVNALIVTFVPPRLCHKISFAWCFGYIVFFRTAHYFGLPAVRSHSNAVQLLLTLKMVGLSFEVHDSWRTAKSIPRLTDDTNESLWYKYLCIRPSILDIYTYCFCYIGLLTGPYYRFRVYHDMLHDSSTKLLNTYEPVKKRVIHIIPAALVYFIFSSQFSIDDARSEGFYEETTFVYRIIYMVSMFIIFRTRLYVAWIASECMCMTATLGVYPVCSKPRCGSGPTDISALHNWKVRDADTGSIDIKEPPRLRTEDYSYETIHNIDIYGCELAPTVREGMRSWNQTVQYWLASFVYRRLPFKNGPLRVAVTMMVSAFWHGVHPGYYLSFITIPLNLVAEDGMISACKRDSNKTIFDWFCWFCKMRSFDYMCMAFLLLNLHDTLRFWSSIYFAGHLSMFAFIILGHLLRSLRVFGRKDSKQCDKTTVRDASSGEHMTNSDNRRKVE